MPKCEKCGKEFSSEQALKIHVGRMHGSKAKTKKKAAAAAKGKFVCPTCGRSFKMAMHLARHRTSAHGPKAAKKAKRAKAKAAPRKKVSRKGAVRRAPQAAAGVDVAAMSVEELVAVKKAVDAQLSGLARQIREARRG